MKKSLLFYPILFLLSCKPEVRGYDNPLRVDLYSISQELCNGNVFSEFERLNNRYIEFTTIVREINRTHFNLYILDNNGWNRGRIMAFGDSEVFSQVEKSKLYKFRGVFKFNSLEESYCTQDRQGVNIGLRELYITDAVQIDNIEIIDVLGEKKAR